MDQSCEREETTNKGKGDGSNYLLSFQTGGASQ
jgi:hypothetical protein